MEQLFEIKNQDISKICLGTGINYIHNWGIIRNIKAYLKIIIDNKNKDKYIDTIKFPKIVNLSMKNNCRIFDTSRAYGESEYILGKSLKKYPRDSYYIVTKLCNKAQYENKVQESFMQSLKELNLEYVDLYLMHWPVKGNFIESWHEMEKIYAGGCKKHWSMQF